MSELSDLRMAICNACPYNAENICILCGCDLVFKTADPNEKCPHTPLKWDTQANSYTKPEVQSAPVELGEGGASITGRSSPAPCIPCQAKSR
jgi:hypothetical protein